MEDDKIKSFFKAMKTADEQLAVPTFPYRKEPRKLLPVFLYVAAAAVIAILITVRYVATGHDPAPGTGIVIEVGQDGLRSHSLIETGQEELSEWESPTEFLSEDY